MKLLTSLLVLFILGAILAWVWIFLSSEHQSLNVEPVLAQYDIAKKSAKPRRYLTAAIRLVLLVGLSLLLMGWWFVPAAAAEIQFFKAADQWIYQAQQQLTDTGGTQWEVTVLKQTQADSPGVYLRFFTSSSSVDLDAAQPLRLKTPAGEQLTAANITRQYFMGELPAPNLAQFDIQPLMQQLKDEVSLRVTLPSRQGPDVTLPIPPEALEEWTAVGSCQYLICDAA